MSIQLCPAQQIAFDALLKNLPLGSVFDLHGNTGSGKSTVLRRLHQQLGGAFLPIQDFIDELHGQHPFAIEEAFDRLMMKTIQANNVVIVDDFHLLSQVAMQGRNYPRQGLLCLPLLKLCTYATKAKKHLIFSSGDCYYGVSYSYHQTLQFKIKEFQLEDYTFLCHQYLDATIASRLDYNKIHRFAARLNAYQLRNACIQLLEIENLDTDKFIDYLRSCQLVSNVNLGEVQPVNLSDLKGLDDILKSLEANLIVPLEHDELAKELDLKPKRGVLLAGPPGTGKTTIGRALAHRLKSKFFLIDGTFISGTGDFYNAVHCVFEAAKQNAPAIVFIDDSDVIFESGSETGLYRYLLTLLDGLESETAGRVCVMMTAMNISNIPPALVRSGRIELWLETRLPDEAARSEILTSHLNQLPEVLASADVVQLVPATEGFTGADLKRLIEDGKNLYAYDRVQGVTLKSATEYFLAAVELVVSNKERYAEAEANSRQQVFAHSSKDREAAAIYQALIQQSFMNSSKEHYFIESDG